MIGYIMTVLLASAPASGTAQLTIDGETTTHEITECSLEAKNGMPARLLIEDMDITLNLAKADHVQMFTVIRDNANLATSRMFSGGNWTDRGQPSEPIISEWGKVIRVNATLTSSVTGDEKDASLVAICP